MKKFYEIQFLKFIRNLILLSLLCIPGISASDYEGQSQGGNLNVRAGTLSSVFEQIRSQTNMDFFYNNDIVDVNSLIDTDLYDMSLTDILDRILGNDLVYSIKDNYILITVKNKAKSQQDPVYQNIRGTVRNERGQPLRNAAVRIDGTKMATISGDDGSFLFKGIAITDKIVICITYVGKQPVKVEYTGKDINVVMKDAKSEIDTVVVTGYFPRIKEGFAGTVTTITQKELQKVSTGNIFTSIALFDAGFQILENNKAGSNPNVLPEFILRGKGSFQSQNILPLFILDGMQVSVETIYDLDMNRIESVTLLKDASAAILYGSRAADGVVVIETKLPKVGDIRISYTFQPMISFADLTGYDLMNAAEKLEYERLAGFYEETDDPSETESRQKAYFTRLKNVMKGVDTYWLAQPVRNSFSHQHSLRIDGGVEQITYAIDAGYDDTQGIMKGSSRNVISFSLTLGYRVRNSITIQNRTSYSYMRSKNTPYGSYSEYAKANPYERIYDDDGKLIPLLIDGTVNPLYDATLANRNLADSKSLSEQVTLNWIINKNMQLRGNASAYVANSSSEVYVSPLSAYFIMKSTYNQDTGLFDYIPQEERGSLSLQTGNSMNVSGNTTLTYNKKLGQKHTLYSGVGGEFRVSSTESNGYTVTGFSDDRFSSAMYAMQFQEGSKAKSSEYTTRSMGLFANLNYIYDNRFFADLSMRYDGSSAIGADKKYSTFWSVGGGWNIHKEPFMAKVNIIDLLKLRGSYGVTGQQNFSAYEAKTTYNMDAETSYRGVVPASIQGYGNPELKWQNSLDANIGFDLSVFKRRFTLSFNYYRKLTMNTVTSITVAPSIGLSGNRYTANLGKILNAGYDFSIYSVYYRDDKKRREFSIRFQGAYNKSKVLKISNVLKEMYVTNTIEPTDSYVEGKSMDIIKAVKSLGIDPATGMELYQKADGSITYTWDAADLIIGGVREPKLRGNIMPNFLIGNWNLNLAFSYSLGADYYNQTLASRVEGANPSYNADRRVLNDRWKEPGDKALFRNINDYKQTQLSTRFIQKEYMIQLKSLSLSYEIDSRINKKSKFNRLRFSAYTNNLFRISTIKEERGLDYPFSRSYVFEISIMF